MATNYISAGDDLSLLAPYDVTAGLGMKVGSIIAIAKAVALSGAAVVGQTRGVHYVLKNSAEAWTVGLKIYWDDSAKVFTLTSSGNTVAGVAMAIAANPSASGYLRLNGSF